VTSFQIEVRDAPSADWDAFVSRHDDSPVYLRAAWSSLAREVFRHRVFFFEARISGSLCGVLPVVQQRGVLGNFATSVPFFSYGGTLADSDDITVALMNRARDMVRDLGCAYLEIRDVREVTAEWIVRTDKASMLLPLPDSTEALAKQLGSKLRSQIKRADREAVEVRCGGVDLLTPFFDVFSRNMRDLGTPVYPVRFFRTILDRFPDQTLLVILDIKGVPSAAGFLVFNAHGAEIPWACCRSDAKPLGANMRLYWEVLSVCVKRGVKTFDFGRSTIGSGPYKFKQQWGAQPRQLYWHRWERNPQAPPEPDAEHSRLRRYATSIWQRLPLRVANMLGARISPGLPW
jgi:serine/alanine adding enzyme